MLASFILSLRCTTGGRLPSAHGRQVHAWLLAAIGAIEPDAATRLHADAGELGQPFTVSTLRQPAWKEPLDGVVAPGTPCELRLTTIIPGLDSLVVAAVEAARHVRIDPVVFDVERVIGDPGVHRRAGAIDPADLWIRCIESEPPSHVTLDFESPTAFRSSGDNVLFPHPDLVLGGLARRWHAVGGPELDPAALELARARTRVSAYELATMVVRFGRISAQKAFAGWCEYDLPRDPDAARVAHLLFRFAWWAGIGYKVGMGMGSIDIRARERSPRRTR